jgi:trehalose utilization protein
MIRVTIFNEFVHEQKDDDVRKIYPQGIHRTLASFLELEKDFQIKTATLQQPEHGLTADVLDDTDVLIWWGHAAHDKVADKVVDRIQEHVLSGMGLIVLHSGHESKIFKRLMGTSCALLWREIGEKERLWIVDPSHPISRGLDAYIELPHTEMYGEYFDVPEPDALIFISWFAGGEVFRSGMTWHRGRGRIFYFRPGHETFPIYKNPQVQKVLINAVRWTVFQGNQAARGIGRSINVADTIELLA